MTKGETMLDGSRLRPTTKDLARAAGVSLATVDRVLNNRPGVRKETVEAVQKAIERIGFVRNITAANLARGRRYRVEFIIPETGDLFLRSVVERIEEAAHAFDPELVDVRFVPVPTGDPHQIAQMLSGLSSKEVDGIAIMAPESPQVRDAIARLHERSVPVVQFISGQQDAEPIDYVGVDNVAAGATAGRLMGLLCAERSGRILVVADSLNAADNLERRNGFDRVLTRDFPKLDPLPSLETHGDPDRSRKVLETLYENHDDIIGVYALSSEARPALEALISANHAKAPKIVAHERTSFTESMLFKGHIDAVIAQNPGHLVRSAIRVLRARCEGRQPIASQEEIRIEILLKENLGRHSGQ